MAGEVLCNVATADPTPKTCFMIWCFSLPSPDIRPIWGAFKTHQCQTLPPAGDPWEWVAFISKNCPGDSKVSKLRTPAAQTFPLCHPLLANSSYSPGLSPVSAPCLPPWEAFLDPVTVLSLTRWTGCPSVPGPHAVLGLSCEFLTRALLL